MPLTGTGKMKKPAKAGFFMSDTHLFGFACFLHRS